MFTNFADLTSFRENIRQYGFNYEQTSQLTFLAINNKELPMSYEFATKFSAKQLRQIIKAVIRGLDPTVLLDPNLTVYKMCELRKFMIDCSHVGPERMLGYDYQTIHQFRRFVKSNLPFEDLMQKHNDWVQLDLCYRLIKEGKRELIFNESGNIKYPNDLYKSYFEVKQEQIDKFTAE